LRRVDPRAIGQPVGPLPSAVYWRRRVLTLLAALFVVFLLGRVFGGGAAAEPRPSPQQEEEQEEEQPAASLPMQVPTVPTVTSATPATPTPTRAVPTRAGPTRTATARPGAKVTICPAAAVAVRVHADARSYIGDRRPKFTLEFGNSSRTPCRLDVGPKALELVITSGDDRIWSSDDCYPSRESDVITFAPGKRQAVVVTWTRDRSAVGCPKDRPAAKPGTYVVTGRVGAVESDGTVFVLR
jgi:hypothetical protein